MNLVCAVTMILNLTAEPWNSVDDSARIQALKVCEVKYGPKAPCLVKFIKKEPKVYNAVCGSPES